MLNHVFFVMNRQKIVHTLQKMKTSAVGVFLVVALFFFFNSTISSASAMTLLQDDFSSGTFDASKWTEFDTVSGGSGVGVGNIQIVGGQLQALGNNAYNTNGLRSILSFDRSVGDITIDADVTFSDCTTNYTGLEYGPWVSGNLQTGTIIFNRTAGALRVWAFANTAIIAGICTNNVPIHIKMVIKSTGGVDAYLNGSVTPNGSLNASQAPNTFTNYPISLQGYNSSVQYDNIVVSGTTAVPGVPIGVTPIASSGQVALSWTAPSNTGNTAITDYVVEYKLSADSLWTTFNDGVSTGTTATVTGLTNGSSYNFRVSAVNAVGTGSPSSTATATPNVSPAAPTNLYGTPAYTQVSLAWIASGTNGGSAIADYIVESRIGSGSWSTFADGTSTATTTTVTGLTNGTTYEFRVSSVNTDGMQSVTSTTTFVTAGPLGLIEAFTGTTIDTSKWAETDSATNGSGGTVGNVQQNGSLTVTGNNAWGTNGVQSVATFDRTNGDISVQVTMSGSSCSSGSLFNFGYGDMNFYPNGTSYLVTKNGASWYLYYSSMGVQPNVAITGVTCTAGTPLTMKLVASQTGGASVYVNGATTPNATISGGTFTNKPVWLQNYSSGVTTTFDNVYVIKPPSPDAPSGLSATAGDGQIGLSWTEPSDNGSAITDYVIEYKSGSGSYQTFADGVSTTASGTVTGLTNGVAYTFRVSAVNVIGTSSPSSTVTSTPVNATPSVPIASGVTISGTETVGQTLTGTYVFADPNGDTEGTSLYRWLRSDTANGTFVAISGATGATYILVSADLNKYLKFEVTPVSTVSPTTGTAVLSSATGQISALCSNCVYHILSTGQSLSVGTNGAPALSTTQPYNNKKLSGTSLVSLIESGVETMSSGLANSVTSNVIGNAYDLIVSIHGVGATTYSGLKKGTTPYNNGIAQVNNAKAAVTALGRPYQVTAVTTIHGESDHLAGTTQSQYEADLVEWQNDYDTDVKAITGQSDTIYLFTDQMSSWTGYNSAISVIPYAQLAAAEDHPDKIVLVGPKYFLQYSDAAHLTNTSYRWLGEYYAKAYTKVVIDGGTWTPLSPRQIVRNGNVIYAQFNVPAGSLVFDTTLVDLKANYGFEYADDSSSASISSVEMVNADTVKITLSTSPTGTNQKLRYAYTGTSGSQPGAHIAGSERGNLRDSDATPSLYGNNLYNWAVHFNKIVTADIIAPSLSGILATVGTQSSTIAWTSDEVGSSIVDYGLTDAYGSSTTEADISTRVTSHSVTLSNLVVCTTYHYRVRSKDLAQNEGISADGTFTTTGCTGSTTVNAETDSSITTASGGSTATASSDSDASDSDSGCTDRAPGSQEPHLYGASAQDANSILLSFTKSSGPVDKYMLEYGTQPDAYPYKANDIGDQNARSYLVQALSPDTVYYFRIRAKNGCAKGHWSNAISAKTNTAVAVRALNITQSELTPKPVKEVLKEDTCQSYTVQAGDTLWSIAKKVLGEGQKYTELIDGNKETYPLLKDSMRIQLGWKLTFGCDTNQNQPTESQTPEVISQEGYDVSIKVVNTDKQPVAGAKVTLHSKVQETTTDANGIATFAHVEEGDHRVIIAYNGYEGEQSVNLTGDVKAFDLTVTVQAKTVRISTFAYWIIGILVAVIVIMARLLLWMRRRRNAGE
jgi:hypothetical protein